MQQTTMFRQCPKHMYSREAIPRRMPNGDLACVWLTGGPREPDNTNVVPIIRSTDDGQTWSEPLDIFGVPERGAWCPEMYVDGDTVYAFVQTYIAATRYDALASFISESHDSGHTFSPLRPLQGDWLANLRSGGWRGGLNVRQGIRTASGKHVFAVNWYEPTRPMPPGHPVRINTDGAGGAFAYTHTFYCGLLQTRDFQTFTLRGRIQRHPDAKWGGPTPDVPLHEPNVIEISPGHLVMLIRGEHSHFLWRSDSHDDGETWAPATQIDIPNPGSKIRLLKGHKGEVILIHNPHWARRNPLEFWLSMDDMHTWPVRLDVDPAAVGSTSGALQYPDGFIDTARDRVYFAWEDQYNIYMAKVGLPDLRRQALNQK